MFDPTEEKPVRLTRASKTFAHLMPEGRNGTRTATSTWFRWALQGMRGVKLETIRCAGALCTSEAAVIRFFQQLTYPDQPATATPKARAKQIARAERTLAKAGI